MLSRVRWCSASAVLAPPQAPCSASAVLALAVAREAACGARLQLAASWGKLGGGQAGCGGTVEKPAIAAGSSTSVRAMGTVVLSSTGAGGCGRGGDDPCITTTLHATSCYSILKNMLLESKTCGPTA